MKEEAYSRKWTSFAWSSKTIKLAALCGLVFGVLVPLIKQNQVAYQFLAERFLSFTTDRHHHFYDYAGLMPFEDRVKFEQYLTLIYQESDIDLRFMFVKGTGAKSIEELAVEKVAEYRIGGKTGQERGVLLLYDFLGDRLRVEVGYGLEGYFPDAFVSYLIYDHAQAFFASGDLSVGLRLLLRLLHHRIRQAILGNEFDLATIKVIRQNVHLSGGAGAAASMSSEARGYILNTANQEEREAFGPQPTPEAAYRKYIEWLTRGRFSPGVDLFTKDSQAYMENLKISKAYFDFALFQEYGRAYKVDSRRNVAVLYFTNDPLVAPHFFVKSPRGWQIDVAAQVSNIAPYVGGIYNWCYRGQGDDYTKILANKLVRMYRYCLRIGDGDNRILPVLNLPLS